MNPETVGVRTVWKVYDSFVILLLLFFHNQKSCDYIAAAPVVQDGLKHAATESHFIYVDVGERA